MKTLFSKREKPAPVEETLRAWLEDLTLGEAQRQSLLEITPLMSARNGPRPWIVLGEALGQDVIEIREQEGGGNVNEVVAHNKGAQPVLIVEGETIVGAKQNRVVVASVLVAAGSMVSIPVGCMERGRWRVMSDKFAAGVASMSSPYRKMASLEYAQHKRVNQARLWEDVDHEMAAMHVVSPSADYHEAMKKRKQESKAASEVFKNVDGQIGVLATYDGLLLGADIVGHPADWGALSQRLMDSHLAGIRFMDTVAPRAKTEEARKKERTAAEWWKSICNARVKPEPARGLGMQLTIKGDGVDGGGLWVDDRPAHVGVFG